MFDNEIRWNGQIVSYVIFNRFIHKHSYGHG